MGAVLAGCMARGGKNLKADYDDTRTCQEYIRNQ